MTRTLVSSSSPYEAAIGFSRAVRVGNIIAIGGTAPIDADGKTVAPGDPVAQAHRCYEIVQAVLEKAGAGLEDVVRTRTFLTRIEDWGVVAGVRGEYFRDIRPVETIVQVSSFVDPNWLLEIEVDAVVDS